MATVGKPADPEMATAGSSTDPEGDPGPSPGHRPARRLSAVERRRQLSAVALTLFAERGYRATTMEDVADAAGVTKPLVYQHFSSKRALYLELVDAVARDLVSAVDRATASADGPRQQVEQGFAAYFHMVVTHEAAFRVLFGRADEQDEELGEALHRVEDALSETIDPLIAAGLDAEHRRFLAYAVVGMAEGASRRWLATRTAAETGNGSGPVGQTPEVEAQQLARRLADLAWAGLRSVHAD